ncbi:MAG: hypothetical protein NVV62_14785 [Terricaulis sp.]|nr:hypothetical protein [Terricaulis sp.]
MARTLIALALLGLAAGCGGVSAPPQALHGLWGPSVAACEAGVGVRFTPGAVVAAYQDQAEPLFAAPRYEVLNADPFRVRIEYRLPAKAGPGAGRGVLVLAQDEAGRLSAVTHAFLDARTGAARLRLEGDPAARLMALQPCGPRPGSATGLRGLTAR